jgi:hypothetical protein
MSENVSDEMTLETRHAALEPGAIDGEPSRRDVRDR